MAGAVLNITNEETISYLKENGFIHEEKKEKKEKKAKQKIAEENN